jgi:hypothetical protein
MRPSLGLTGKSQGPGIVERDRELRAARASFFLNHFYSGVWAMDPDQS